MHSETLKARLFLAVCVCAVALAMLAPSPANAQVTINGVEVQTISTAKTATYCGGSITCAGGITVWPNGTDGGFPVTLTGGQTLLLTQTGTTTCTGTGCVFGNFDTSDQVQPNYAGICSTTNPCETKIFLDTGSGSVLVYDSTAGTTLTRNNTDTGNEALCEGANFGSALSLNGSPANYTVQLGYADNLHTTACNLLPAPWNTATHFMGAGVARPNIPGTSVCNGTTIPCFDAGAILITGVTVPQGCTLTQGFWKTHGPSPTGNNTNVWPVTSLKLGTVTYTAAQLQSIFDTPVKGNGLIDLAHQLIAAKLNIANGANPSAISSTITAADNLIGSLVVPPVGSGSLSPSAVGSLVTALDNFNSGLTGPGSCD
jgi:hypothetical protein